MLTARWLCVVALKPNPLRIVEMFACSSMTIAVGRVGLEQSKAGPVPRSVPSQWGNISLASCAGGGVISCVSAVSITIGGGAVGARGIDGSAGGVINGNPGGVM